MALRLVMLSRTTHCTVLLRMTAEVGQTSCLKEICIVLFHIAVVCHIVAKNSTQLNVLICFDVFVLGGRRILYEFCTQQCKVPYYNRNKKTQCRWRYQSVFEHALDFW